MRILRKVFWVCLLFAGCISLAEETKTDSVPSNEPNYDGWIVILKTPPLAAEVKRDKETDAKRNAIKAEQAAVVQKIKQIGQSAPGANRALPEPKATFNLAVNAVVLDLPKDLVERVRAISEVQGVYPNYILAPTLATSLPTIGATELHETYNITGCVKDTEGECVDRIRIAILDTGVDYNHPAFKGKMWENLPEKNGSAGVDDDGDGFTDNIYGADFEDCDGDPMDDGWGGAYAGHGTHVASIASAVAPDAQIIALSTPTVSAAIRAIEWAMGATQCSPCAETCDEWGPRRADVMNMSFETASNDPDDVLCQAVNRAITQGKIVVAVAAGNSGLRGYYTVKSPGIAEHAITVGNFSDINTLNLGDDRMNRVSSRGYIHYNENILLKPELTAPGTSVCAAALSTSTLTCDGKTPYRTMSGTSMSSPHIAGAAALLFEAHPDWLGAYPERIKSALMNTTRNICASPPTILAQGTGAVSLVPASQTLVLASPGMAEFGEISRCTSPFSISRTIEIRNLSDVGDKTFDITVNRGDFPADVLIDIPSSVFVSKEDAEEVAITMSASNPVAGNNRHQPFPIYCWTNPTNCDSYSLGCPYGYEGKFIFTEQTTAETVSVPFFLGVRPPLELTLCGSTAVSPDTGCKDGGTEVTICGRGFSSDTEVWFGEADPVSPTLIEPFKIIAVAPPHNAGTVDITVGACGQTKTLVDAFTYDDAPSPIADFSFASPVYVCQNILFTNASNTLDYPETTYFWEFGDGETSSEISPQHIYLAPGTYTAELTATNLCGSSAEEKTIEVLSGPRGCFPPGPNLYKTDMNCDGCVDELIDFSYSFGSKCGDNWHNIDADFDANGTVDGTDLSIFVHHFGKGCF